jgi:hypothetical protein
MSGKIESIGSSARWRHISLRFGGGPAIQECLIAGSRDHHVAIRSLATMAVDLLTTGVGSRKRGRAQ